MLPIALLTTSVGHRSEWGIGICPAILPTHQKLKQFFCILYKYTYVPRLSEFVLHFPPLLSPTNDRMFVIAPFTTLRIY